jgi:hypothetical protein
MSLKDLSTFTHIKTREAAQSMYNTGIVSVHTLSYTERATPFLQPNTEAIPLCKLKPCANRFDEA